MHVLILAAGQGKRMHSALPKVLHSVLHRPMLHYVVDLAKSLSAESISVVVGHGEEKVREACTQFTGMNFFSQKEQKGTAHAVRMAESHLKKLEGTLLILYGDVICLTKETLEEFYKNHEKSGVDVSVLSAKVEKPKGYGRILRNSSGDFVGIREEVDCSEKERAISEINSGIYAFNVRTLCRILDRISNRNHQGEFYLTDSIEILVEEKHKATAHLIGDPQEIQGVNDRNELSLVEKTLQSRTNLRYMLQGVSILNPESVSIDPVCEIGEDTLIEGGVTLVASKIGRNVVIESGTRILHSEVEPGTRLKQGCYIEHSHIGMNCQVGPYAHLRPETTLSQNVKIGNFVETKKSTMGEGSKAPHLTYLGDATVGKDVNIGCGFITCNYDGKKKFTTVIEDGVFIGSDSQAVAPVVLGKGSYIAAGTTITRNVPPDSLAISRGKQQNKEGFAARRKKN